MIKTNGQLCNCYMYEKSARIWIKTQLPFKNIASLIIAKYSLLKRNSEKYLIVKGKSPNKMQNTQYD